LKRLAAALLVLLVSALTAAVAAAHTVSIVAAPSIKGTELTFRALDVYGAAVPTATVTAVVVLPGGSKLKPVKLAEGPEGIYHGSLPLPAEGLYQINVDLTVLDQLFRAQFRGEAGQDMAETLLPMQPIDVASFSWGPILYGGAVIVLVTATAVAIVRRRRGDGGDEEEE
jgi:hypothetical protein